MTRSRGAALLAALLAVTVSLAACGGDDDGDSSADEQEIIDAITASATSGDPAACTEFQTQRFTEQTSGGTGEAAVTQCEEDAADAPADEVDVTNVEIDGDSATADAAITGAFLDGQTIEVALVKEDDQWKLDELGGFVEFDRDAFVSGFEEGITSDQEVPPEAAECAVEQLEAQSDEELQAFVLGTDQEAEQAIFGPCEKLFREG